MGYYEIIGGVPLCGSISIHGAKNSVLPIFAAALLCNDVCRIENCPYITDVDAAIDILRHLGCAVRREGSAVEIDSRSAERSHIPPEQMGAMRGSVLFLGALLGRFSEATLSQPGGCPLGDRPIDLHLRGLRHMGFACAFHEDVLYCKRGHFCPCTVALPFPSVGATENLLLAAVNCPGETVICNAAREPEIGDLMAFLRACGAELYGDGSSVLAVHGGKKLHGCAYAVMPDRMEAASYLAAGAATRGDLHLNCVRPGHLRAVTEVLTQAGCEITEGKNHMRLRCNHLCAVPPIRTAPYDGFPTDAQAPVMAAMATAEGVTVFEETVFSHRMAHVPALCAMGAQICAGKCHAVVRGVPRLRSTNAEATDLRGGMAIAIAMMAAEGRSELSRVCHIHRGYDNFAHTLRACGAQIKYTEGQ